MLFVACCLYLPTQRNGDIIGCHTVVSAVISSSDSHRPTLHVLTDISLKSNPWISGVFMCIFISGRSSLVISPYTFYFVSNLPFFTTTSLSIFDCQVHLAAIRFVLVWSAFMKSFIMRNLLNFPSTYAKIVRLLFSILIR